MSGMRVYQLDADDVSRTATRGAEQMLAVMLKDGAITREQYDHYTQNVVIFAIEPGWLRTLWNKATGRTTDDEKGLIFYPVRLADKSLPMLTTEESDEGED